MSNISACISLNLSSVEGPLTVSIEYFSFWIVAYVILASTAKQRWHIGVSAVLAEHSPDRKHLPKVPIKSAHQKRSP